MHTVLIYHAHTHIRTTKKKEKTNAKQQNRTKSHRETDIVIIIYYIYSNVCQKGSDLGRSYFAPRSTQLSVPPGSVNEYQLRLGRQRLCLDIVLSGNLETVRDRCNATMDH